MVLLSAPLIHRLVILLHLSLLKMGTPLVRGKFLPMALQVWILLLILRTHTIGQWALHRDRMVHCISAIPKKELYGASCIKAIEVLLVPGSSLLWKKEK